ncbi:MAG: recombinase family protein [Phycisphaerae bacterium]|nr:recombinase family protein [Phycisphaerae bacterium]
MRCAIYTRKSSDEGLQQEFNSLDAQREAAEAYIASQKAEGWVCLPDRYDDGGFTGGNTERPALKRLLADIEAGRVDTVVVYKIDRFSRSLADFMRMMTVFEKHGVAFVSVTQAFDTSSSMGRLTLNILLSFAQFEREIIGERIRDKIAASRQRGKWTGGTPILGFDVDRSSGSPKLVVNPVEASFVRQIFELYVECGTLLATAAELERRGWRTKVWKTRSGAERGGFPFDKCRLHVLLTNVLYVGRVRHKKDIFPGEHEAIVPKDLFDKVQRLLARNRNIGCAELRNRHGALLRGLLHCKACGRAMVHTFTTRGSKRYRYYTCTDAIKRGRRKCPVGSLPAGEIERAVVEQIRCVADDPELRAETLAQATADTKTRVGRLEEERRMLQKGLKRHHAELRRMASAAADTDPELISNLADQIADVERRLAEIDAQIRELQDAAVTESDVAAAFADFEGLWSALTPREQVRVINLLVQRVDFDAADSTIEIAFHDAGIRALANGADRNGSDETTSYPPSKHTTKPNPREAAA